MMSGVLISMSNIIDELMAERIWSRVGISSPWVWLHSSISAQVSCVTGMPRMSGSCRHTRTLSFVRRISISMPSAPAWIASRHARTEFSGAPLCVVPRCAKILVGPLAVEYVNWLLPKGCGVGK